jgi:hypothetical protein
VSALIPLLALLLVQGAPDTRRESWPDGSPREEYQVERDKQGREVRSGPYRSWHPNGNLASEGVFAQDRETGKWRFFHPDGTRAAEGSFARGERAGFWETFHASGPRESRGRYEKDHRTGEWSFWTEEGELDERNSGVYEHESRRAADGRTAAGERLDGELHGEWKSTWPDGGPQLRGRFERGKPAGTWLFLDREGHPVRLLSGVHAGGRVTPAPAEAFSPRQSTGPPPPVEPGALGPLADPAALSAELATWTALDEKGYEQLRREHQKRGERPVWQAAGLRALPLALEKLQACDVDGAAGRAEIGRLDARVLRPLLGGHALGALTAAGPATAEEAREVVRAWSNLWAATRDDAWFWRVELPLTPLSGANDYLCAAPLWRSPMLAEAATAPPLLARRYEPRSGPGEAPLRAALEWLERSQLADGSWSPGPVHTAPPDEEREGWEVGVTSLACLALLGAGKTPQGSPALARGIAWLLEHQDSLDGRIWTARRHDWVYGHAMATIALSEACMLAPGKRLHERVQSAVDVLFAARNPYGAWRYALPPAGDNDTSVTAWATVALFTAREAGLSGEFDAAFEGVLAWLDLVTDTAIGRVGYSALHELSSRSTVNGRFEREKGEAMTAAGLLCRLLLGQKLETHPILRKHAELVRAKPPLWDPEGFAIDEYYFYYGAQAVMLCGDPYRAAWEKGLKAIANAQSGNAAERGSWDPVGAWAYCGGRVYSTALLALALEAPFRYELAEAEGGKRRK